MDGFPPSSRLRRASHAVRGRRVTRPSTGLKTGIFLGAFALLLSAAPITRAQQAKPAKSPLPAIEKASWIWGDMKSDVCEFRTVFTLERPPTAASILITADNGYELYINGSSVGFDVGAATHIWNSLERYDVKSLLAQGRNVIGVRGICLGGMRGLVAALRVEMPGREPLELLTDGSWQTSTKTHKREDYSHPEFLEEDDWKSAKAQGKMGMAPWGKLTYAGSKGGRREGALPSAVAFTEPEEDFRWPGTVAFVGDDCSAYRPLRGDVWGVCFRVGNWSRAYTEFDLPCPSKIGRKLYVLDASKPDAEPRLLLDVGKGVIGGPSVSYDGQSFFIPMAAEGESFFHIYRVPVNGGVPVRLTDGPFHDIDPSELPDGRIVFTSTRIGSFEEYHNPPSRSLFVMNADGGSIQAITYTLIFDNEPKVTADGRIAFIRTDNFFDRAKVETQIHVVHPDGSGGVTEIGANVGADYEVRLRRYGYGSPAPMPDGRLACISSRGNFICTPGTLEPTYQRLPGGLGDLAALPDGRLLATILRPEGRRMNSDLLGVIDPADNTLVAFYESSAGSVHSPVFVGARPRPPVRADVVDRSQSGHPSATGFLYCQDARFTKKTKADWEQVRAIRVLGAIGLTTRSSHSHIVHAGHETVELGTVPLAPDGSFYIEVPADMPMALQAVDAEGRSELNEMSWIYVRPDEQRSCVGCHHDPGTTPPNQAVVGTAARTRPLKLLGQGVPHRFRGNNSGVTGMMDLQFERFRETASMNRHLCSNGPMTTGRQEVEALVKLLRNGVTAQRISSAQRLGLFRSRAAATALAATLRDPVREVKAAAALALATCGTRESVLPLLDTLADPDPVVAQAAAVAVENLTGHAEPFLPFAADKVRDEQAGAWRAWFTANAWDTVEKSLVERVKSQDRATQRRAMVALGHVGGEAAKAALRDYVSVEKDKNPYPQFVKNNRTDRFTYGADSPLNPRTLQEAVRALGHLRDTDAIPLFDAILARHTDPVTGNLYLAEASIDALGVLATPEAEAILVRTMSGLQDYVKYVGWYSDHPALYACHASPLHARIISALDTMGSKNVGAIVPHIIRSVPTDPDRALFPESDTYETLAGRVILRSGRGDETVAACLALLGDTSVKNAPEDLKKAISAIHGAWAGKPAPDNRAAQVLSFVCRDRRYEPQVRAAYERYRAKPEDAVKRPMGNPSWIPQRHWVLFFLGRTLGNLGDPRSVDVLAASLKPGLNEARHGRPDPSEPNIHFLQLEYTPCWRAAAAWALGEIGEARVVPLLMDTIRNMDNAIDTRHASAEALGKIPDPASLAAIRKLAADYPEVSTRRALLAVCEP